MPWGNTNASGSAIGIAPVTATTIARLGRPLPVATNVEPTHGRLVATSTFAPPLLAQPVPVTVAVAGQVVVRCATNADSVLPTAVSLPPTKRPPSCRCAIASAGKLLLPASGDHETPFHRAM